MSCYKVSSLSSIELSTISSPPTGYRRNQGLHYYIVNLPANLLESILSHLLIMRLRRAIDPLVDQFQSSGSTLLKAFASEAVSPIGLASYGEVYNVFIPLSTRHVQKMLFGKCRGRSHQKKGSPALTGRLLRARCFLISPFHCLDSTDRRDVIIGRTCQMNLYADPMEKSS